jgi:DNA repair protein RecO (recombination protein O)
MNWTDTAIVLSTRKYGENSVLARLLTSDHGVCGGVIRGAHAKANRGILQPGNVVSATWQARLSEHLGSFKTELLEAHAARVMADAGRISALSSACTLLEMALPERHPYPRMFTIFHNFLKILADDGAWPEAYVRMELDLLAESGFGLDLRTCAATGATENLIYVSPKSGRAVSMDAGEPYKDKMLPLPGFLLPSSPNTAAGAEILAGMHLTGYFLEHWLFVPHGKILPAARNRLYEQFKIKNHAS